MPISFREAYMRGVALEERSGSWLGHVLPPFGRWPAVFSKWHPPAWALGPKYVTYEQVEIDWPLAIELVPRSSWGQNARQAKSRAEWDLIRQATYARAENRCEICGGRGPEHAVEAHEKWHYDDLRKRQVLTGIQALCPACHRVKHFGKAYADGRADEALEHLAEVNGMEAVHAELYAKQQIYQWQARSRFEWKVNMDLLEGPAYQKWLSWARGRAGERKRKQKQESRALAGTRPRREPGAGPSQRPTRKAV